jgi:succinate dehydrogenase / fumarate reductase, cytochrome b subunit
MAVSILHRITGGALTVAGLTLLVWWLSALADGEEAFADFAELAGSPFGLFVLVGLSWAWFQHLLSGIRHLFMDAGQAFEIGVNKRSAWAVLIGSLLLTAAMWAYLLGAVR